MALVDSTTGRLSRCTSLANLSGRCFVTMAHGAAWRSPITLRFTSAMTNTFTSAPILRATTPRPPPGSWGYSSNKFQRHPTRWIRMRSRTPPADAVFWAEVAGIMAERGSLLLEAMAVQNSPRWHRLLPSNVASVRAGLQPRSTLQLWPDQATDITGILSLLKGDLVQVIWEDSAGKITEKWFAPDSFVDARAVLATASAATVMSADADESHPLLSAVVPDADGVVRARWTQ